MAKITLNNISGGYVSIAIINGNFDTIEAAFENTLSRDGTSPNTMLASLDMNSNRIINLAAPTNNNDAARLIDIQDVVTIAIAPSQSGNKGKFLITDGSTASWSHAFCDTSDFTKKIDFDLSGITTGTTRTKTFQNQNGTIYETGGTDVAVTDGGTGLSTFGAKGAIPVATAATTLAAQAVGTDGYAVFAQSGATTGLQYLPVSYGFSILNGDLNFSVAASALTIAIKGWDGADPSATNPVFVAIRSATAATSLPTILKLTAATSVVVSSGSTLGTANSIAFRIWVVGFNDAGTFRLGVINCVTTTAGASVGRDVTAIFPLSGWAIASSTAEGGAGAADSAQTFYTGTAVASKGYVTLGYGVWESGLATVGTWSSGPTRTQLYCPSVTPLPGQLIQKQRTPTPSLVTVNTTLPYDDTIPQNTEGTQVMTQAITPTSAANILSVSAAAILRNNTGAQTGTTAALFQDATAGAIVATGEILSISDGDSIPVHAYLLAGTTSSTTFKVRMGTNAAGSNGFNGDGTPVRIMGGVSNSHISVEELMG